MRRFIVVDENDQPIGLKAYSDEKYEDIYRVSSLWVTNSQGDILLNQRKLTESHDPGKWSPAVNGTNEEGDTYESNIYQEAEEEIGLTGIKFRVLGKQFSDTGKHKFFVTRFHAVVDRSAGDFKIDPREVEQVRWFNPDQLLQELKTHPEKFVSSAPHDWPKTISLLRGQVVMNPNHPNESVTIVDETDRPIGSKLRKDRTADDIYRISALWLTNSQGQVLLAQRGLTKNHDGGKWGPAAAGTVAAAETYEQNIYREAEEEIGVSGVKFQLGPKRFYERPGRYRQFRQWFTAELDWPTNRFKAQEAEVERVNWFDRQQLIDDIAKAPDKFVFSAEGWKDMFLS